ncbi:MAG: hypothetical protein ACP5NU_01505 [Methanomicrobiales archaeon]|jgi:hypothetical protein|nr:hypothetical protein [Burkholderiaceae bacterium]NLH25782.1 hypothetical protein [Methanomicrobiales archaeon]HNB03035.1 hypothetical protein [Methanoregulaceae archaeon]HNI42742.1 hypothetical protein [Methanoregulaceae archaeon]HNO08750.1 hypothetical protein [Methanoregulaceae archaeon]
MMYENAPAETAKKSSFKESLMAIPGTIDSKMPTMDKSLDRYFDAHMSAIIEEWGLITMHTLDDLDDRLDMVTTEIRNLERGRDEIEKRAAALDEGIRELEVG